jgi:hypothetical protein
MINTCLISGEAFIIMINKIILPIFEKKEHEKYEKTQEINPCGSYYGRP